MHHTKHDPLTHTDANSEEKGTFSNMSGSARVKEGQPDCKGDPILGTTSPTELERPSFPIDILLLFISILSLLLSTSLADGEVIFCCASISCCWCWGASICSWWKGWEPGMNDFGCWRSPGRSWSRPWQISQKTLRLTKRDEKKVTIKRIANNNIPCLTKKQRKPFSVKSICKISTNQFIENSKDVALQEDTSICRIPLLGDTLVLDH